jgi:hypothetical protein
LAALTSTETAYSAAMINGAGGAVAADGICSLLDAIDNAQDSVSGSAHADCMTGDPSGSDTIAFTTRTYLFDAATARKGIVDSITMARYTLKVGLTIQ